MMTLGRSGFYYLWTYLSFHGIFFDKCDRAAQNLSLGVRK